MTTPPPTDRPTEPLRPLRPTPPVVEERYVAPSADPILVRLEDAVASLRTWLAIVGLLAVVALGVGIYALVAKNDTSSRGSRSELATDQRVSRVDDRVDRLKSQVQSLRSALASSSGASGAGADTAALSDRVDQLEQTSKTLAARPATDSSQAVKQLSGRIDDLARDVEQLKQQSTTTP